MTFLTPLILQASDEKKLPEGNVPDAVELAVLEDIYTTMGGSSWTTATNWPTSWPAVATSTNYATWYGITVENNDITQIWLPDNGLSGDIPSSIGDLTEVFRLNFSGNNVTGSIPTSIGNMSKLLYFWVNSASLSGSIPSEIGDASLLRDIQLFNNDLTGSLPSSIGDLTDLQQLTVGMNQLSGAIPSSLGNCTDLTYLHLGDNDFEDEIPSSLGSLTALTQLFLSSNDLTGSIPTTFGALTSLLYLHLEGNQLTGSIPSQLGNMTALKQLYLHTNKLSGTLPSSLGSLANLEIFQLSGSPTGNQITGSIPTEFGNLSSLVDLWLPGNLLSGDLPSSLGNLDNLWRLDVTGNDLSGMIPSSLGNMDNLRTLSLGGNGFTGSVPASLANLSHLTTLDLHINELSGVVPTSIGSISTLTTIDLSHNKFTFADLLGLIALKSSTVITPQALVDTERTVNGAIDGDLTLTTTIDRSTSPGSTYQWFSWISSTATALNTESTSGHTFVFEDIESADDGIQFFYRIKNSSASTLVLQSNFITLNAVTCTVPSIDFEADVEGYTYTFNPAVTGAESCTTSYLWDFGDGQTSTDPTPTHVYNTTGTYAATLTLTYTCGECEESNVVAENPITVTNTSICSAIFCDGVGGVGIGTMRTQGFRLSVDGKIRASDIIKVYPQGQWSDFVFEKNYNLLPLSDVEKFIKKNGHLPEIPSAKEVETEGVELGSMDAKLLQKIEELTLYVIELQKEVETLKKKEGKK